MMVERNLLISLLKLTKNGPVLFEDVKTDTKIVSNIVVSLLRKLQNEDTVYLKGDLVEANARGRMQLAIKALSLGADVEEVAKLLRWQEFEEIASVALECNGYVVQKNVRFKHCGRRWEIDVVGCRKPIVICADCKRWQRALSSSSSKRIAVAQVERVSALAEFLPNASLRLECQKWSEARFIPAVLALLPASFKFYDDIPIVPVLQLQDFISQLPTRIDSVRQVEKRFGHLSDGF